MLVISHLLDLLLQEARVQKLDLKLNEFQLKNLAMAIVAAKLCNLKERKIFDSLNKIKEVETELKIVDGTIGETIYYVPNVVHPSVPIGKDKTENKIIRKWGKIPEFSFLRVAGFIRI